MNIFVLDRDPRLAAKYHCNKHVVKMILETAQLLSTAHHVLDGDQAMPGIYKATHRNHPSAVWVRSAWDQYDWTHKLLRELLYEYTWRYDRLHACVPMSSLLERKPRNIARLAPWTSAPQCMPDEYKRPDVVDAYRAYYKGAKSHMLQYKNREVPEWLT